MLAEINFTGWSNWVTANNSTFYEAGLEARRRMAANGFDVPSGDTWALNELSSAVRKNTGIARQKARDLLRGLYSGDGTVPQVKGVAFDIGIDQATGDLAPYKVTLQDWYADGAFWQDMSAYRRKHDAREGFLFSFGIGGGQMRYSGQGRTGSVDLGLRMGYGFSDRFQLFGDLTADVGQFQSRQDATSWILSLRGQTVLIGDRDGNGLNLNLGVGIGGLSINYHDEFAQSTYPAGVALVSGLSYDARIGQQFALSPELYVNWHLVPNDPGLASDNLYTVGLRLNFLWYAP